MLNESWAQISASVFGGKSTQVISYASTLYNVKHYCINLINLVLTKKFVMYDIEAILEQLA